MFVQKQTCTGRVTFVALGHADRAPLGVTRCVGLSQFTMRSCSTFFNSSLVLWCYSTISWCSCAAEEGGQTLQRLSHLCMSRPTLKEEVVAEAADAGTLCHNMKPPSRFLIYKPYTALCQHNCRACQQPCQQDCYTGHICCSSLGFWQYLCMT